MGVATDYTLKQLKDSVDTIDTSSLMQDTTGQDIVAAINALGGSISPSASNVSYDNSNSGLAASNVQAAIDELANLKYIRIVPEEVQVPSSGNLTTIATLSDFLPLGTWLVTYWATFSAASGGVRRIVLTNSTTSSTDLTGNSKITIPTASASYTTDINGSILWKNETSTTLYLRALQTSGSTIGVKGSIRAIRLC